MKQRKGFRSDEDFTALLEGSLWFIDSDRDVVRKFIRGDFKGSLTRYRKSKWIEALTSGEYDQADGHLRVYDDERCTESFCCLGVYADIFIRGEWDGENRLTLPNGRKLECDLETRLGPESNHRTEDHGIPSGAQSALAALNDAGFTFDHIAKLVRRCL